MSRDYSELESRIISITDPPSSSMDTKAVRYAKIYGMGDDKLNNIIGRKGYPKK